MDNIARRDLVSCESCEALLRRQRKGNALHHVPSREFFVVFFFPNAEQTNPSLSVSPGDVIIRSISNVNSSFPLSFLSERNKRPESITTCAALWTCVCGIGQKIFFKKLLFLFSFFLAKQSGLSLLQVKRDFGSTGEKKNFRHLLRDEWKKRWVRHTTSVEISWREPVVVGIVRPSINLSTRRLRDRPCLTKESNRVCVDRKSACGRRGASRPLAIRQLSLDLPNV